MVYFWNNYSFRLYREEMVREVGGKLGECSNESLRKRLVLLDVVEISSKIS